MAYKISVSGPKTLPSHFHFSPFPSVQACLFPVFQKCFLRYVVHLWSLHSESELFSLSLLQLILSVSYHSHLSIIPEPGQSVILCLAFLPAPLASRVSKILFSIPSTKNLFPFFSAFCQVSIPSFPG